LEAETATAGVVWQGGERLREIGRRLRETGGIPPATVPPGFAATLRPYQQRGVDWLQFLRAAGLGGVLADDMGLGKTVQTLAHIAIEKAEGRLDRPVLVVAPTSVLANWGREAERFTPNLSVLALHGPLRKGLFREIPHCDLVLTTYPLLSRDREVLEAQAWHLVVLDEAQTIKNPDAATTRFARGLDARHRLCLTGTPLENHLGELWSLFAFLAPGFLGDRAGFNRRWRTPIEKKGDAERRLALARRVRPFLLRRTKAEVAADLPPKTEIVEPIEMEAAQRDLYESIRLAMHARVREAIAAQGLARSHIVVLDALLKLRQVCCDPRLLKLRSGDARKARSAKLDRLMEMLPALIEEGRRILLFSQFTSMLALIESEAFKAAIPFVVLTGDTRDRATPIRRFQAGEVPLFLISLKAGGVGLNLTAADTVIHYDPWWNPAVEDQATDRAHRIGQDKPVFVHKLMTLGSIEEKMEALKARKRALAAGLFDPDAGSTLDLAESDVEDLFGGG
jgi:SNF2 family DNA or RNA helicase